MFKNQLQELAQRSCFNLPSYSCIREGPDHAPRFKATVNFNGDTFESPTFCSTLRQAEHAAAEVALNTIANRGPSRALAARVLDETGVYKNLLQETAHRAGLNLPVYTTIRSGPGHVPIFTCTVELARMSFTGEPARTKKQAQKSAAVAAWSALKKLAQSGSSSSPSPFSHSLESKGNEEQEQAIIARLLASLYPSETGNSTQNDQRRHGQQRSIPFCRDSTPPIPSLYPTLCQSWASSGVSPEMPMYQMWQQEQLLEHQNCLLALPFPPATLPGPQNFPFLQSMFYPDYCLYFPAREQESMAVRPRITIATSGPSFYFSNHSVPNTIRGRSTVTIQEIHDDKTEELSDFPPSVVPRIQEPVRVDDKQKNSVLENNIGNIQLEGNRTGQSEWTCGLSMDSSFTPVDFQLQPCGFNRSQSNLRPNYAPRASSYRNFRQTSVAAPVDIRSVNPACSAGPRSQYLATGVSAPPRMRTGAPTCSTRLRPERLNLGGRRPTFIAPAVRIRSVVPVCSAPPARKMPSSGQEEVSSITQKNDAQPVDVSTASLELGKLQL